ncbi:MAG: pyridoxal phosphate enzyme (YggS family) [Flavobacterium sp.]|jgi:pyridoxal phosphate enzyme (YggS family)
MIRHIVPEIDITEIDIRDSIKLVKNRISSACLKYGRNEQEVKLLAVSKTKPLAMVEAAIDCGQQDFGENYLQDAHEKILALSLGKSSQGASAPRSKHKNDISWHFIGAIQSNKTKIIAENFDWVHTVSSVKVARRLSDQRPKIFKPLNILIQINIDAEISKSGILPDQAEELIESIHSMEQIKLRGLMAIPAKDQKTDINAYKRLRNLLGELKQSFALEQFDQLSMGMSGDLELAIAEGSTIVRVGTDIFGARATRSHEKLI